MPPVNYDLDGDGVVDDAELIAGIHSLTDRERICNDSLNTAVMAALIGEWGTAHFVDLRHARPIH